MALADSALVITDLLQQPNSVLNAVHPVGWAAAAAGGDVRLRRDGLRRPVRRGRVRWTARARGDALASSVAAALLTAVLALCFDLLFFAVDELPATVPVALALVLAVRVAAARGRGGRAPGARAGAAG